MGATGTIFDLKRFAVHDGPGIRTTVFLKGCPLACWWCHNPESRLLEPERVEANGYRRCTQWTSPEDSNLVGREVTLEEVMREIERDIIFFDESGGGVTFSGGEPLMQPGFLEALVDACRQQEIHVALDTSGYVPWSRIEQIRRKIDLFLYDLKLMDEKAHQKFIHAGNQLILNNLRLLDDTGVDITLRVPLIPDITDTDTNLSQIAAFIGTLDNIREVNLLPYNPMGEGKYRRFNKPSRLQPSRTQSDDELVRMQQFFLPLAVDVKIGG